MPAPISIGPRKYISGCRPTSTIHIWIGIRRTVIRWASTGSSASLSDCGGQMRLSVFSRRHMRNRRGAPPRLVPHACWAPRFCRYARHPKTSPTRGSGSPDSMPMRPRTLMDAQDRLLSRLRAIDGGGGWWTAIAQPACDVVSHISYASADTGWRKTVAGDGRERRTWSMPRTSSRKPASAAIHPKSRGLHNNWDCQALSRMSSSRHLGQRIGGRLKTARSNRYWQFLANRIAKGENATAISPTSLTRSQQEARHAQSTDRRHRSLRQHRAPLRVCQ